MSTLTAPIRPDARGRTSMAEHRLSDQVRASAGLIAALLSSRDYDLVACTSVRDLHAARLEELLGDVGVAEPDPDQYRQLEVDPRWDPSEGDLDLTVPLYRIGGGLPIALMTIRVWEEFPHIVGSELVELTVAGSH
jgi:hypothetical protein